VNGCARKTWDKTLVSCLFIVWIESGHYKSIKNHQICLFLTGFAQKKWVLLVSVQQCQQHLYRILCIPAVSIILALLSSMTFCRPAKRKEQADKQCAERHHDSAVEQNVTTFSRPLTMTLPDARCVLVGDLQQTTVQLEIITKYYCVVLQMLKAQSNK